MKMKNSTSGGFVDENSWPPGFRFHPTDEELVLYYLKRKICRRRLKLNVIGETDVYKWDPEELPGLSVLKSGDKQWFFFSPRDRKYPNGARSNRATRHGYWKTTGKDRNITCNSRTVGLKKTLVFYKGRAPNGERTDWVMHEYTMDEEELKKCQNVKDYYALYKVYKKSGPGPKNGEQYGAPFREEEWADDDNDDYLHNNHNSANWENPVHSNVSFDSLTDYDNFQPLLDDMQEILHRITDENQAHINDSAYGLPQVGDEEEIRSTMVDPSLGETISTEPCIVFPPSMQQFDVQARFEVTQLATSYLQSYEAPEVTSAHTISEREASGNQDDFLEINDLISPEPSFSNMGNPGENLQFEEINGLDGPDLYFDAAMFLRDMGPIDQGTDSQSYFDTLGNEMASQLDYQLQSHSGNAEHISSGLWTHDTLTESYQVVTAPPTPGVVHTGSSANLLGDTEQNQGVNEGNAEPWFTTAAWSFLESIPTYPASASENALINRAFERMSSFGRVRINAGNPIVAVGEGAARERRVRGNRGFLFLSVLGAVCAVLWVLMIGTTVKLAKTFFGRFISS
ncbi:hypothetical protein HHK36_030601 [Tetracentron sinense]|uniref:NAC domain-containing protein n=1 Tax=Tetracentron sinense TaxID=13715 RepID=A0A835CYF4_TETSI|nr:hypothetical protein HHK36_030601 [Tetracentron sinense]